MKRLDVPALGATTPQRGNAFSRAMGRLFLGGLGWSFHGRVPNVDKAVLIVAPHTSNWDFFIGVAAMFALGLRVDFLGKHSLFGWPLGPVMRWLGGIPVDRRVSSGVVETTADLFAAREQMILGLAPEGTRSSVRRWRSGFYFIARRAGVPVVPVAFDYRSRLIRLGELFQPTGDLDGDMRVLAGFFDGVAGRRDRQEGEP